ncbi:cAMP-activated global transcriptional regulator CRP [Methylosoma difficile]
MASNVLEGLKNIDFLANVPDKALKALALRAKQQKFSKQALIISEGDESSSLYIIVSGKVRIFVRDDKSKEVTLMFQESGSYFGELALLGNEPRSASVQSVESTVCSMISKNDFVAWLIDNPEVMLELLSNLSEKVRHLTDKVKHLALSNVYERTTRTLNSLAIPNGEEGFIIRNRPTQHELSTMVGASREMVNKIMKDLTKGGYIIIEGKNWIIPSKLPINW